MAGQSEAGRGDLLEWLPFDTRRHPLSGSTTLAPKARCREIQPGMGPFMVGVGVSRPGVPRPTSECRRVPQPRWVEREGEREGGRARRPETGVREVGIPRPSCSSRAQVGCACSRGLQASTRERERAASSERLFSSSSPRDNPL
jgi:hypothetical protein